MGGVLESPTLELRDSDYFVARIPAVPAAVTIRFESVSRVNRDVEAEITIEPPQGMEPAELYQRLQLFDYRHIDALKRAAKRQWPEDIQPSWDIILEQAVALVRKATRVHSPVHDLVGDLDAPTARFLVKDYVVWDGVTILYGPGGRGKTMTALAMAVSVDAGSQRLWKCDQAPVLYINLERSAASMSARLARINRALGINPERPILSVDEPGKVWFDVVRDVRRTIRERGIGFVVVDSLSRMGLGDLNDNDAANRMINALKALGCAVMAIGHTPDHNDDKLYGSVHQGNGADLAVVLKSEKDANDNLGVALHTRKQNDGTAPKHPWQAVYEFELGGLARIRRPEGAEFEDLGRQLTLEERVRKHLGKYGEMSATDLADALGDDANRRTIAHILRKPSFVGRKVGKAVLYGLAAPDDVPEQRYQPDYEWDGDEEHCAWCGSPATGYATDATPRCHAHLGR